MAKALVKASLDHLDRTAGEPRESSLHWVVVREARTVNESIRLLRLQVPVVLDDDSDEFTFLPGQWLDVHIPGIPRPGGFTITSVPRHARPRRMTDSSSVGYVELAIQRSPANPPAAWFWQPETQIIGMPVQVRVGGSFVWPPPNVDATSVTNLILVAGGVGINPLISILGHLTVEKQTPNTIRFLYSSRTSSHSTIIDPESILFLPRLTHFLEEGHHPDRPKTLDLFLTGTNDHPYYSSSPLLTLPSSTSTSTTTVIHHRRITPHDLLDALGPPSSPSSHRAHTVCYICGPPAMTDAFTTLLRNQPGMSHERVLCEKWW